MVVSGFVALGVLAIACGAAKNQGSGADGPGTDSSQPSDGDSSDGNTQDSSDDNGLPLPDDGLSSDDLVFDDTGTGPSEGKYCQEANVKFEPQIPTVYVLVDRSSSMFESMGGTDYWEQLKTGILPVLQDMQADVRLGFGSYTGTTAACDALTPGAPIAINNYAAIEAAYNALGNPNTKAETPTSAAIAMARDVLLADESPGDRFILLISDGNPDFCDDGSTSCGADAVISELQASYAAGIRTLVFGIENSYVTADLFDYFAQAGRGEEPSWAEALQVDEYNGRISSECRSRAGWAALKAVSTKGTFDPLGTYSAAGGTAKAVLNANPTELATIIRTSLEGLKSCTFDLSKSNVEVKAGQENTGEIFVDDMETPIISTDWRMLSSTTLELLGDSCVKWQSPEVTDFFAGFPCSALVIK